MRRWLVQNKKADFKALGAAYGIDQVVARCIINRGIKEEDFTAYLHPDEGTLYDPALLCDGTKAAGLLADAIGRGKRIRVIGDYDVDGIFSTYILKSAIERAGGRVDYDIPHRMRDGYGLNVRLCQKAIADGVEFVITCDNGIRAFDEIKLLKDAGLTVVVTDHHELDFTEEDGTKRCRMPEADATVNPHRPDCPYPFKSICGAVVAWKVMELLYDIMDLTDQTWIKELLPFAAFATICDIMPLVDENRILVTRGLKALEHTANVGMRALLEGRGKGDGAITSYDIGFILGPCFNASGRLSAATEAVELLEEESVPRAIQKAQALLDLNETRKTMTEQGTKEAIRIVEESDTIDTVLVVYIPTLHESLAGIVAGRLRERYYRPVFVLCDGETSVKGSGRSIPGYPMATKLHDVEDILLHYGGHPMAAGLSLEKKHVESFKRRLNEAAGLSEEDLTDTLSIDVAMPLSYVNEPLITQLSLLEPFGEGNDRPLFADKDLIPYRMIWLGKGERRFLKFIFRMADGRDVEAVYFGDAKEYVTYLEERFGRDEVEALLAGRKSAVRLTFTYFPQVNSFRGKRTIQARIEDYR